MAKAEAMATVFEMMNQRSTKSKADLIKTKKPTVHSRAIERDICDDLLYQQHQKHLDNPKTQLLNEGQRRSVDNESSYSYTTRRGYRTFVSRKSSIEVSDFLCQLLKQQSAPHVYTDGFDGNPPNFKYFTILFREVVEIKKEDPRGTLTCLIKYRTGEAKELIKHCIEQPANKGYENAINLLYRRYGDQQQGFASPTTFFSSVKV